MKNFLFSLFALLLAVAPFSSQASNPTSITDNAEYRKFCLLAATNDELFEQFKRAPIFIRLMPHVSLHLGKECLKLIYRKYPHLLSSMDKFRENDSIGNPITHEHGKFGLFSSANLRYIKIAGEIEALFGPLSGKRIIEIGGGFGGQCKILADLFDYKSYTLIDLPEPLLLAEKYLECLGIRKTIFSTLEELNKEEEYDLVISNYAFSECRRHIQKEYLEKVIKKSHCGYMLCNQRTSKNETHSPKELVAILRSYGFKVTILDEAPKSSRKNYLLIWKGR